MTQRARAECALAGTTLIWGLSFVVVKSALAGISPLLFLSIRFTISAGLSAMLARGLDGRWRDGMIAGTWMAAGCILQTTGLQFTTPAKSAFLTAMYIVLTPLLSAAIYHSAPRPTEWIGVGCAAVGMALLTFDEQVLSLSRGDSLSAACALAFAFHILVLARYSPRNPVRWLTFAQMATAATLCLALTPVLERPTVSWTPAVLTGLAFTSLLTNLAFGVQTWAQAHTTPTRTALILASEPIFASVASYILAGESFGPRAAAGAGLILGGILLVELKPARRRAHLLS